MNSRIKDMLNFWYGDIYCPISNNYVIENKENESIIKIEAPGVDKENIDIEVKEKTLTIKCNCKKRKIFHEFDIKGIDRENIKAKLDKGILTINLPLLESEKPKKIQIE